VHAGEQPVEDGTLRLEIEPLDVEHAAIAGLHHDRDPPIARGLSDKELHIERVAFLDDEVEAVEERAEVLLGDALRGDRHLKVRIDLGDPSGCDDRLVDTEVEHRTGDPVEVRELEGVEVGEAELAGQPLHGHRVRDRVPRAETDDADAQRSLERLLLPRQLVPVPVEP